MSYRTSAVFLDIGERRVSFVCDWASVDAMQSAWGIDGYHERLTQITQTAEIEGLCQTVSFMTDMTIDEIKQASPPIRPTIDAINLAWARAWIAPDQLDKEIKQAAKEESGAGKKTRFAWPWKQRSELV